MLDVGSGSGYTCALFHHLMTQGDKHGKVIGIDHIPELKLWAEENLRRSNLQAALDAKHIELVIGDGRKGYREGAPAGMTPRITH